MFDEGSFGRQKSKSGLGFDGGETDRILNSDGGDTDRILNSDGGYTDKVLICEDCKNEFVFTAGEQKFYAEKNFQNEPKRCKECRDLRKRVGGEGQVRKKMYEATCASCGNQAEVPFEPTEGRPVYCSECFAKGREDSPRRHEGGFTKRREDRPTYSI